MELTSREAHYVLSALIGQGTLRASQVRSALKWREAEIRKLRMRLASLENGGGIAVAEKAAMGGASRRGRPPGRSRSSARVRRLRKLQGRYMGYVRRLKAAQKARVRSLREKKGILPAIRLAASLARKS